MAKRVAAYILGASIVLTGAAGAADRPDFGAFMQAQRDALQPLAILDGVWRGKATVTMPDGESHEMVQTERVGRFLDGTVRVIEGRGYGAEGELRFNAMAIISYSPGTKEYNFRSYAQGRAGDFPLEVRDDGFSWSTQMGPARIRYSATVKNGVWMEIGERLKEGEPPLKIFEMRLERIGDTDWPAAGAVQPE